MEMRMEMRIEMRMRMKMKLTKQCHQKKMIMKQ